MKHQIDTTLSDADAVVRAFADASKNFDKDIFGAYVQAYPALKERLTSYANVWLLSVRASTVEIYSQDIPADALLKAQSRLLAVWENANRSMKITDVAQAAGQLDRFCGEEGLKQLTKLLLRGVEDDEDVLVMEYLDPGLLDVPFRVNCRLAEELNCEPSLVPHVLEHHRMEQRAQMSAQNRPAIGTTRTWEQAIAGLSISSQRKIELLKLDE